MAAVDGRPEQKGSLFTVYPIHTIPGNVDAATGHIKFKGDLVVKGNVMDGMRVETRGRIEVMGMVAQSTVVAGGEVVVHKNILGSTVRAGGPWILLKKAQDHLVEVGNMLETLLVAAQQMKSHPNFAANPQVAQYGEGIILKVLLERKYTEIPAAITGLIEHLETLEKEVLDGEIVAELLAQVRDLYAKFSGLGPLQFKRLEDLVGPIQAMRREVDRFADHVHGAAGHTAQITVSYVQNSRLEASGVVRVTGKGAYYCDILAGGSVVVDGTPGIFRNGTISAGGDVLVRELGSPSEALTSVQVPKEAVITADRLHPGVTLKAGARVEKFRNYTAGVRFHQ
ncbi:hypothetical protein SY88_04340 [Clostridiales bacterium PH28_bin88]|nr:hypothetical protein SY88_04340 [Clostridiales bacterium PH28_bin88]